MSDETNPIASATATVEDGAKAPAPTVTKPSDGQGSPSTEPEKKPESVDVDKLQHELDSVKGRVSQSDKSRIRAERESSQLTTERDTYMKLLDNIEKRELANWKGDEDGTAVVELRHKVSRLEVENARLQAQVKSQDEIEAAGNIKETIASLATTYGVDAKVLREAVEGITDEAVIERVAKAMAPQGVASEEGDPKPSAKVRTDSGHTSGSSPDASLKERYPTMY